jgi:hypothetical protein
MGWQLRVLATFKEHQARIKMIQVKPSPPSLHFNATPAPLNMRPCSILELDATRCHWPLGGMHDAATQFCGGTPAPGHRYCPHHLRVAHGLDIAS